LQDYKENPMIPMVNLINIVEKELELERQGHRRTSRWIGAASRVTDARWFQRVIHRISPEPYQGEASQVAASKPCQAQQSALEQPLNLARRQPACGEC
jgi:hypothetical protein